MDDLTMLTAREQLMEDIDAIVDDFEYRGHICELYSEELTRILCDAVCKNFPAN